MATTNFTCVVPAVNFRTTTDGKVACTFQRMTSSDILVLISRSVAAANALIKKEEKDREPVKAIDAGVLIDNIKTDFGDLTMKRRPRAIIVDDLLPTKEEPTDGC